MPRANPQAPAPTLAVRFELRERVPSPIVTYCVLGLLDFALTLLALEAGHREANPFLAWAQGQGLFEPAKLGTLLIVVFASIRLWRLPLARGLLQTGNCIMAGVFLYHMNFWLPQACWSIAMR